MLTSSLETIGMRSKLTIVFILSSPELLYSVKPAQADERTVPPKICALCDAGLRWTRNKLDSPEVCMQGRIIRLKMWQGLETRIEAISDLQRECAKAILALRVAVHHDQTCICDA